MNSQICTLNGLKKMSILPPSVVTECQAFQVYIRTFTISNPLKTFANSFTIHVQKENIAYVLLVEYLNLWSRNYS